MLKAGGPAPEAPFGGLEVLLPARDYKNRHASILLALDATLAAFDEAIEAARAQA
jgi:NifU-like protein involved in Fe-S cluster formation